MTSKSQTYLPSLAVRLTQVGAEYLLSPHLVLVFDAKYYFHDYTTLLIPSPDVESEIKQTSSSSFAIGLRYTFGVNQYKPAQKEKIVE